MSEEQVCNNDVSSTDTTEVSTANDIKNKSNINSVISKGKWGERRGIAYIFSKKIKSIDDKIFTIPDLVYKKIKEKEENEKKIVILKLNGQEQKVEFYKDDFNKGFGIKTKNKKGGKSRSIWCNDEEYKIINNVLKNLIADEKYFNILKENSITKLKNALNTLEKSK